VTASSLGAPLGYREAEERIREFEAAHDVLRFEVDGWACWAVLRFPVQLLLTRSGAASGGGSRRLRLALALRDVRALYRLSRVRYVAKTFSSGLVEEREGRYKDVWFDDLFHGLDWFKIEAVNNIGFLARRRRALRPSNITTSLFDLLAGALARLRTPPGVREVARSLAQLLTSEFREGGFKADWVATRLAHFYWEKWLYRWLLGRLRPRLVLTADPCEYALVAAAKERGITVIEMQHGFLDRHHAAYSWTTYALPFRFRMPVPDIVLLYGEHWKRELELNGFWDERLRVAGSPRIDCYRTRREGRPETRVQRVLVTTQGVDTPRVLRFIRELLREARGRMALEVDLKLHPVYEPNKTPYLRAFEGEPSVRIIAGNESPSTLELMVAANVHLSISSTCHWDALGLGVPTVTLPFESHEVVLPLCVAGHSVLAESPGTVIEVLRRAATQPASESVSEYYFEPGALERIRSELVRAEEMLGMGQCADGELRY